MSRKVGLSSLSEREKGIILLKHGLGQEFDTRTKVTKSILDLRIIDRACDSRISIIFLVQDYCFLPWVLDLMYELPYMVRCIHPPRWLTPFGGYNAKFSRVGSGPPGFNLTRKKVKKQQAEQVEFLSFY
jgi:hypothetical protein